jgi:hypothetical protein
MTGYLLVALSLQTDWSVSSTPALRGILHLSLTLYASFAATNSPSRRNTFSVQISAVSHFLLILPSTFLLFLHTPSLALVAAILYSSNPFLAPPYPTTTTTSTLLTKYGAHRHSQLQQGLAECRGRVLQACWKQADRSLSLCHICLSHRCRVGIRCPQLPPSARGLFESTGC